MIVLDSLSMNLQDDLRPNDDLSCGPSGSLIELCLVQSWLNLFPQHFFH